MAAGRFPASGRGSLPALRRHLPVWRRAPPRAGESRVLVAVGLAVFVLALAGLVAADQSRSSSRPSSSEAVRGALSDPEVRRYLRAFPYTRTRTVPLDDELMRVSFFDGSRIVLDAAVASDGSVPHTIEYRPGYVRPGSRIAQTPIALLLSSAVFALALACVPLRRMRNLDVAVLLSFVASIVLLNERLFELSVWTTHPPLAYLGARCLWIARRGGDGRPSQARRSTALYEALTSAWSLARRLRMLRVMAVAAALALVMVSVPGGSVGDVGFASIAGATTLLHGSLPYGHLPSELVHGDTYPLLAYASYLPVALFMPVRDAFDNLDGALIVTAVAALIAALAVHHASKRLSGGGRSPIPLRHALAWLSFPPVLITASSGSNDLVVAAAAAGALALLSYPGRSIALLTIAAWVKLVPVFVLPAAITRLRSRGASRAVAAALAVTATAAAWLLLAGGLRGVWQMVEGVSFQADRGSLLSFWTVLGIEPLQPAFQAAAFALVAVSVLWASGDRRLARDPRRLAALAGAIVIAFQLGANYWSHAYLTWVLPFLILALFSNEREASTQARAS